MVEFCNEHGIVIKKRRDFAGLRVPGGPAGPDSDLLKLASMFESGQNEIGKVLTREQVDQIIREKIKPGKQG